MDIFKKYFPDISTGQLKQLERLEQGLIEWNEKINVISRKDIEHLQERHLLHSLAIARFIHFSQNTRVIDVGTGGGLPGLPLAIMFPACRFTLVDSIGKKIKVVNELVNMTGISNVKTINSRAEAVRGTFDFVISRAVTSFPAFHSWTKKLVRESVKNEIPAGIIALKGGDLEEELSGFRDHIKLEPIRNWFAEPFFETKFLVYLPMAGNKPYR